MGLKGLEGFRPCRNRLLRRAKQGHDGIVGGVRGVARCPPPPRHCERSEAIQSLSAEGFWIASSQELLAMTGGERYARVATYSVIASEAKQSRVPLRKESGLLRRKG